MTSQSASAATARHRVKLPTAPMFQAVNLTTTVPGHPRGTRKVLLDDVSFEVPDNSLIAILGPSGAGKTTLLHALTGLNPAETGYVYYGGRDLYADYDQLRQHIGYVPQFDALHGALTLQQCLDFAAELRLSDPATRATRTSEVMKTLGLTEHAQTLVKRLSGGQRKRASVAMELLSKPGLIFLDEPTSGLDPGLDSDVMAELRTLAHDPAERRIIFVVTHSLASIRHCDMVLVMAPGGRLVACDTPDRVLQSLQAPDDDPAEMFALLNRPDADGQTYLRLLTDRVRAKNANIKASQASHKAEVSTLPSAVAQFGTLVRRSLRVTLGTKAQKIALVLVPAFVGALALLIGGDGQRGNQGLAGPPPNPGAMTVLLMLILMVSLLALMGSIQSIVEEQEVYRRERAVGQSRTAYLASKMVVIGAIALVQTAILALVAVGGKKKPEDPPVLDGFLSILVPMLALGLAVAVLGLALSALSGEVERSRSLMVVGVIVLVILSGAVELSFAGKDTAQKLVPTSWAQNAMAAATDLNCLDGAVQPITPAPKKGTPKDAPAPAPVCPPAGEPSPTATGPGTKPTNSGAPAAATATTPASSAAAPAKKTPAPSASPAPKAGQNAGTNALEATTPPPYVSDWASTSRNWWVGTLVTLVFVVPFALIAWFALRRYDPKRRKKSTVRQ